MWEIYSIGEAQFLSDVLTAVALVTGTGDFRDMIRVGMLLCVLLVMIQALRGGGRSIDLGQIVIAWLVYATCFAPPARVAVTSVYDGTVRVVGNVPLGIAALGSIVSKVGFSTTRLMETAFSTPAMTSQGYGAALEVLKRVRVHGLSTTNMGAANSPVGGSDFAQSWINYIKECTIRGIHTGHVSPNTLRRSANFMDALRFQSDVFGTQVRVGAGAQNATCSEAHTLLRDFTLATALPAYQRVIYRVLGLASAAEVDGAVSNALSALGVTGVSETDFQISALLVPLYDEAVTQDYAETHRAVYATMVQDAVRARNAQWMAQQSVFDSYVRPMLTFLEGFGYAALPILAVLMVMGSFGIVLAGRYVQMLFWIQLWMPVLAIVNLYLHNAVSGALDTISSGGNPLTSMAGLVQSDDVLTRWLAVGGMVAASTPVLALFLATGAISALSGVAGRLSTGENVTPEVAGPRTVRTPFGRFDFAAANNWDPIAGTRTTGSERVLPSFSFSRESSASVESARTASQTAQEAFRAVLSRNFAQMFQEGRQATSGETVTESESVRRGEFQSMVEQRLGSVADSIARTHGITREQALALSTRAAASTAAGRPLSASAAAEASSSIGISHQQALEASTAIQAAIQQNRGLQADLTSALARDISQGRSSQALSQLSAGEQQELSRSAERVVSTNQSYQEAQRNTTGTGTRENVAAQDAVQAILRSRPAQEMLQTRLTQAGLAGVAYAYSRAHPEFAGYFGSQRGAEIYAGLRALEGMTGLESRQPSNLERDLMQRGMHEVLSTALGTRWQTPTGASLNEGLSDAAPAAPGAVVPGGQAGFTARHSGVAGSVGSSVGDPLTRPDMRTEHGRNVDANAARAPQAFGSTISQVRAAEQAAAAALQDRNWMERARTDLPNFFAGQGYAAYRWLADGSLSGLMRERAEWARGQGLTEAQAELYAWRAATPTLQRMESGLRAVAEVMPSVGNAVFGQENSLEQRVRDEAQRMGMDPSNVIGLIRGASRQDQDHAANALGQVRLMNERRGANAPVALSDGLRGSR